uniref:CSON012250 protein n=1 Tax=Culicoides sonorensis TaxID=179676 RepID=A0A336M520_CULSO
MNCNELESLDLSYNQIKELPHDIFQFTSQLKAINLAGNQLSELDVNIFNNLSSLQVLDLSKNNFRKLSTEIFKNLNQLLHLSISGNPLMEFDVEKILRYTTNLKEINIAETFLPCQRLEKILNVLKNANVSIQFTNMSQQIESNEGNAMSKSNNYDFINVNDSICLNDEQFEYQKLLMAPIEEQTLKLLKDFRTFNRNQERIINRLLELENNFKFLEQGLLKIMTEMREEMNQLKISIENSEKSKSTNNENK